MGALARPRPALPPARGPRPLRLVEATPGVPKLHLLTYVVGNAAFWALWAAVSVSADRWYWWATVPIAGWTLVLGLHFLHAYRRGWVPRLGKR